MTARPDLETVKAMLWKAFSENGPDIRRNSHSPSELVADGIFDMDVLSEDLIEFFAAHYERSSDERMLEMIRKDGGA